eukprot:355351-Chlamydomonas_euryale.AAC.4
MEGQRKCSKEVKGRQPERVGPGMGGRPRLTSLSGQGLECRSCEVSLWRRFPRRGRAAGSIESWPACTYAPRVSHCRISTCDQTAQTCTCCVLLHTDAGQQKGVRPRIRGFRSQAHTCFALLNHPLSASASALRSAACVRACSARAAVWRLRSASASLDRRFARSVSWPFSFVHSASASRACLCASRSASAATRAAYAAACVADSASAAASLRALRRAASLNFFCRSRCSSTRRALSRSVLHLGTGVWRRAACGGGRARATPRSTSALSHMARGVWGRRSRSNRAQHKRFQFSRSCSGAEEGA